MSINRNDRYETLILAIPEITNEESTKFESQFNKLIKDAKGSLLSFDRWGKYKLAYPVRKNDYGVYYLTRFEVPTDQKDILFRELKDLFKIKFNDIIMRHLVSVLAAGKTLEYTKPRSLEEGPQDIDSLLQKNNNKMKNLNEEKESSKLNSLKNSEEEEYEEA